MPYKNEERQREAVKQATRKYREGITKVSQGITQINTVEDAEFVVKCLKNKPTRDIKAIQVLPLERVQLIRGILADRRNAGLFDDSADRWQRAIDYREWELEN